MRTFTTPEEIAEETPAVTKRWPGWIYDGGEDPDYRFSFANERTFLAWIRTALAFLAAGVALDVVAIDLPMRLQRGLAVLLAIVGLGCALAAAVRWGLAERAMRRHTSLPTVSYAVLVTVIPTVAAVVWVMVSL